MKTILEISARFVISITNVFLLLVAEPYIGNYFPQLAPYSLHLVYTGIVILGLWISLPLIDLMYGYHHKHDMYVKAHTE